jgi:hypothetical protein
MAEAFLRLSRDDQIEALNVVATQSGRPPHILEKDVWVVWTLQALFSSPSAGSLVFKGGTSLSKAYGVIDRFSEDIDITYDIRELISDLTGDDEDPIPPNDSQQRKWRKAIEAKLPAWVEADIAPHLRAQLKADGLTAQVEAQGDRVWVRHAPASDGWGYMTPDVMIEFGARSTGLPIDTIPVECDAAAYLPDLDFPTATPRVMRAERTFWEKATAVHVFCRQGRLTAERLARHWYDLVRLDDAGYADRALADRELARHVADHKASFFAAKGIDYLQAVSGGLRLLPEGDLKVLLRADYDAMIEGGLLSPHAPSFEDLMARCRDLQDRANASMA